MELLAYFQTKCPTCKMKLKAKALGSPKPFSNQPAPAGQCHDCKTQLQWVRSWRKVWVMAVTGAIFITLLMTVLIMIKGSTTMTTPQFVGQILGFSIVLGFLNGKELAVTQTPKPPSE